VAVRVYIAPRLDNAQFEHRLGRIQGCVNRHPWPAFVPGNFNAYSTRLSGNGREGQSRGGSGDVTGPLLIKQRLREHLCATAKGVCRRFDLSNSPGRSEGHRLESGDRGVLRIRSPIHPGGSGVYPRAGAKASVTTTTLVAACPR